MCPENPNPLTYQPSATSSFADYKTVRKKVIYEQPLNEQMRGFLRLEYLFASIVYHLKGPAEWDSRTIIDNVVSILELTARIDFKTDLLKDLKRQVEVLEQWQRIPKVDTERLDKLLSQVTATIDKLSKEEGQLGQALLQHQLVTQVRQRRSIVGGTSRSDLPGYHYWLQRSPKQRQGELSEWLNPLEPLREAIELNMYLIRNNVVMTQEVASAGFFQSKLDTNASYQLIQVALPLEYPYYPEINAGKQRFTVRFLELATASEKPLPTTLEINFELGCCML
jgi:cell division protein ZapD